jgi:hypothetical protein
MIVHKITIMVGGTTDCYSYYTLYTIQVIIMLLFNNKKIISIKAEVIY